MKETIKKLYNANDNFKKIYENERNSNPNYSYTLFAKKLGIDRTYPEKIINYKQMPSLTILITIRNLYGISIDTMLFEKI